MKHTCKFTGKSEDLLACTCTVELKPVVINSRGMYSGGLHMYRIISNIDAPKNNYSAGGRLIIETIKLHWRPWGPKLGRCLSVQLERNWIGTSMPR